MMMSRNSQSGSLVKISGSEDEHYSTLLLL